MNLLAAVDVAQHHVVTTTYASDGMLLRMVSQISRTPANYKKRNLKRDDGGSCACWLIDLQASLATLPLVLACQMLLGTCR